MAVQIWVLTAFSEVPKKVLMRRCCLIHLKNNSTRQRGSGDTDEGIGEVGIQAPVALLVGVGKGVAGDAAAQAQVVEFVPVCAQGDFDIAQALAVGELGEGQAQELVEAGKGFDVAVAVVVLDAVAECFHG